MNLCCRQCRFWDPKRNGHGEQFERTVANYGNCRFLPPTAGQPDTHADQWCGQFVQIEAKGTVKVKETAKR